MLKWQVLADDHAGAFISGAQWFHNYDHWRGRGCLGFSLILPDYVPNGLSPPTQANVFTVNGRSDGVALVYQANEAGVAPQTMLLTESRTLPGNFGAQGEPVTVKGVWIFLDDNRTRLDDPNQVTADWIHAGTVVHASLIAGRPDADLLVLRDEMIRVVGSMMAD